MSNYNASQPQAPNHQRIGIQRSLGNLVILILAVLLARRFIQVHLGVQISGTEALGFPLAATLIGFLFKYLPTEVQEWVGTVVTSLLCSRKTTMIATGILVFTMAMAFFSPP